MSQPELLIRIVQALEAAGVEYMVTGSVASSLHGEPRSTHDIDLVVAISAPETAPLLQSFPWPDFYLDEASMREAIHRRGRKPSLCKCHPRCPRPHSGRRAGLEAGGAGRKPCARRANDPAAAHPRHRRLLTCPSKPCLSSIQPVPSPFSLPTSRGAPGYGKNIPPKCGRRSAATTRLWRARSRGTAAG